MKWISLMLVCLCCFSCGKTEKKRRTLGYKGEAKNNPFLAAERFLTEGGSSVESQHGLSEFNDETTMVFLPTSSINTVGRAKRLLAWVEQGGHLVVMLDGGERSGKDFVKEPSSRSFFDSDIEQPGIDYLLGEFDLELDEWDHERSDSGTKFSDLEIDEWEELKEEDRVLLGSEQSELMLKGEPMTIHHWSNQGLAYPEVYENEYGSGEGTDTGKHRYLSVTYDEGRVTWLTDARPLRNRYIGYADHTRFLAELVDLSQPGKIIFSSGDGDGLSSLLWRHFPFFVIAMVIAIALWLWRNLPRFGPEQDIDDGGLREYSSQVSGIGRFLWHHKRDDAMLVAMRATVNRSLSLHPGASHKGVFDQLAEKSELSEEAVIEAMTREQVHDPGVMVRVIKNLQQIRNSLTK